MADASASSCSSSSTLGESEAESDSTASRSASLLERLKCPSTSELSRKHQVHCNQPPPKGRKRSSGERGLNDLNVPPSKRVSEYPNEQLTVSAGKMFCKACREILSLKRNTIENHVKSAKHVESKQVMEKKHAREKDIAESLRKHNELTRVYWMEVVETFLRAGVPIAKVDIFRELLEENAFRQTDSRHMLDYVPYILAEEKVAIKEIEGKFVSVVFDGTSRLGEVLAVVLRFISEWTIQQRLVHLEF